MGNLFIEEGLQLVSIHMKDVGDAACANSVHNMPKIGEEEEQFRAFVMRSKLITDPLKKQTTKRSFQKLK